jgi:hypothetical protein
MALPAAGFFSTSPTTSAGQTALNDWLAVTRELPGGSDESELTIASGSVTATRAQHTIDTESDAASDDLANVIVSGISAQWILLRMENSARVVTLKHEAGGAGQLSLSHGQDVILAGTQQWVLFWVDTGASPVTLREIARSGFIDGAQVVEVNTAVSGAPNVLTEDEAGKILTNEGATAANYHTLPTARKGLRYTFVCQDTDGMRIVAATGDTIGKVGSVTPTAGYVETTTQRAVIELLAINATEWIAVRETGTWTYSS